MQSLSRVIELIELSLTNIQDEDSIDHTHPATIQVAKELKEGKEYLENLTKDDKNKELYCSLLAAAVTRTNYLGSKISEEDYCELTRLESLCKDAANASPLRRSNTLNEALSLLTKYTGVLATYEATDSD